MKRPRNRTKPPFKRREIILLEKVPGYLEQVAREREGRVIAFFDLPEEVCGIRLRPFTLEKYIALRLMRSPFLLRSPRVLPTIEELAAALWLFSEDYRTNAPVRRWFFLRRCRKLFIPKKPLHPETWKTMLERRLFLEPKIRQSFPAVEQMFNAAMAIDKLREIVDDAFSEVGSGNGSGKEFYSDAAFIIGTLAREYGWDEQYILRNLPLKRAFQYLKEIQEHHLGEKAGLVNPSDLILHNFIMERRNAQKN